MLNVVPFVLGPVDGFDQDQAAREADKGGIAFRGLVATHRDPLEALQFAHGLLDPSTGPVEHFRKVARPVLGVRAVWDYRNDAAFLAGGAVCR